MSTTLITSAAAGKLCRRRLLGMLATAAVLPGHQAFADAGVADAMATIQQFNRALLATMKAGLQTDFNRRFQALAPSVDQAFDLPAVLAMSIGAPWARILPDQQSRLLAAFRRYTVASYVANFDSYAGQSFTVLPDIRSVGEHQVIVQSRIVPASGDATELDYVMRQAGSGWRAVDVLVAGSISRVAVQRSDFRQVLTNGGGDALLASLQRKTSDLSGGALA